MNPESHTKTKLALYRRGSVAPLRRLIGELDVRQEMTRDIDIIIEKVREHLPTAAVNQLMVVNPTDDDGIWWFSLPDVEREFMSSHLSGTVLSSSRQPSSHQKKPCGLHPWIRQFNKSSSI
jgi:hypothetical protein